MLKQKIKNGKICYFYGDLRVSPSKFFYLRKILSENDITGTKTGTF